VERENDRVEILVQVKSSERLLTAVRKLNLTSAHGPILDHAVLAAEARECDDNLIPAEALPIVMNNHVVLTVSFNKYEFRFRYSFICQGTSTKR